MILNRFNLRLLILLASFHILALIIAPVIINYTNNYIYIILLLPSIITTNTTWALIHEGIHSNLSSDQNKNLLYSRFLSILLQINFETSRFGHLMHHRFNRSDYDLTEGYDSNKKISRSYLSYKLYLILQNIFYYLHISIGLYLFEVIGPILLFLPSKFILYIAKILLGENHEYIKNGENILLKSNKLKNIRIDNILNIILFIMVFILYSNYIWVYISYFCLRGLLISSTDNQPHYGASLDRIDGGFNLKTSRVWQAMILNFNHHRTHHRYPNISWDKLPGKFKSDQDFFDSSYFKQYFRQWQGIISKNKLNSN